MRLKLIACKVMQREVGLLAAECDNFIDITYLRQGYHNEPDKLRKILQNEIDKIDADDDPYSCPASVGKFDAILLGYGLCSNGIVGISSKKYPLVIPRGHDCITVFLGSKERYLEYFNDHPGTYWYTPGWIENTPMPNACSKEERLKQLIETYDEDNAEYLLDIEFGWIKEYKNLAYVSWPNIRRADSLEFSRRAAEDFHWAFDQLDGDQSLLKDMIDGRWDDGKFLIVPPGKTVIPSYDKKIIAYE